MIFSSFCLIFVVKVILIPTGHSFLILYAGGGGGGGVRHDVIKIFNLRTIQCNLFIVKQSKNCQLYHNNVVKICRFQIQ